MTENNRGLKNRKDFSTTMDIELWKSFDELAKETRIPKSKLLDEAIQDLINKHKEKSNL